MVAGDEESAVARTQRAERFGVRREVLDRAVDHVAGDRDQVGFQLIDAIDDRLHVVALDRRADVDVAQLDDGEVDQRRRQPPDRYVDVQNAWRAAGVYKTDQRHQRGERRHADRRRLQQGRERLRVGIGREPMHHARQQQKDVT